MPLLWRFLGVRWHLEVDNDEDLGILRRGSPPRETCLNGRVVGEIQVGGYDHRPRTGLGRAGIEDGFAMYEFAFKELGFRLPFREFAVGVFDWLRLALSQLHPNSLAFIWAFEIVRENLEVEATIPLFFRVFKLQRQPVKNEQHSWVSLKH
ncbi:hypothetical protein A2U01_0002747 [Trifolium medium]|uniref:Transposase (putative) gypsy type domain-containing protein n=1 Tax=Trifolium medium TaxID=97028 RepID=A0A392M4F6_9FABA|nr:hypothetical protein [Trifolium medium]